MSLFVLVTSILIATLVGWVFTLFDDTSNFPSAFIGGTIGVIIPLMLLIYFIGTTPTALHVYQGRTTLEITYKDSIPIDSVVVFKDKK
jgi:hypothetical protein